MTNYITAFIFVLIAFTSFAQSSKKHLDHSVYTEWKIIKNTIVSNDGKWVSYTVSPQKNGLDGWLYLYNVKHNRLDSIPRAAKAKFSPNSDFLVFHIQPPYDTVRSLKLKKTKKDKLPKDSLGIWLLDDDKGARLLDLAVFKSGIKSYKIAEENSSWIACHLEKAEIEKAVSDSGETSSKKKEKQLGTHLMIFNPLTEESFQFENVDEYAISKSGQLIAFKEVVKDSLDTSSVWIFDPLTLSSEKIFESTGELKNICIDEQGTQISFLLSEDTTKHKVYQLMYWSRKNKKTACVVNGENSAMPENMSVSEHFTPWFSKDGSKLYFGIADTPEAEPEDTLLDEEKVKLDVWNWKDKRLQPEQLKQLEKDLKKTYLSVFHVRQKKMVCLGNKDLDHVRTFNDGDAAYALGFSTEAYERAYTWKSGRSFDVFLINIKTGEQELLLENEQSKIGLSPSQKYMFWYAVEDSAWFCMNLKTRQKLNLTGTIPFNFFQEVYDVPNEPYPYGLAGWEDGDAYLYVYDRYDIWKIHPQGKKAPVNITKGWGRSNKIRFRYLKLDPDKKFFNKSDTLLLMAFNENNKQDAYYKTTLNSPGNPEKLFEGPYQLSGPVKAKNANLVVWKKSNFNKFPDVQLSHLDFKQEKQISFANPQQKDYWWGHVELVKWTDYDGIEREGLLYYPGKFDSRKKYPMIVYYYEKDGENLYHHYFPKPSYSVISFPMYTSNGYFIFVPDIHYKTGFPGKSAYEAIMSGTEKMIERPYIDEKRVGLQGQSWGGYETAFMITQTDFFKAAMGGAVVSNMTSAYGGIRWGSGVSRMFQYEEGQSRIGSNLWENRALYIENSPVFFADKVKTPFLMMHNDNDGAVPWYQGIEMFGALRRLNKPVWMLTYNGEEHNLGKWPNRMDLSIRMMQFFDHYLKDQPAPVWMEEGIPATKKGKITGYEIKK